MGSPTMCLTSNWRWRAEPTTVRSKGYVMPEKKKRNVGQAQHASIKKKFFLYCSCAKLYDSNMHTKKQGQVSQEGKEALELVALRS